MGLAGCAGMPGARHDALVAPMSAPQLRVTVLPASVAGDEQLAGDSVTVFPSIDEQDVGQTDMEPIQLSADELARVGDAWQRLRHGFQMNLDIDNDRIAAQRDWYIQHQTYLDRISARAGRYLFHTMTEAEKRGLPTELALLPVIESAYDPFAYSRAQAAGMWQLIPGTGKILGLHTSWWYDGRRDVVESTRAAYDFLISLHDKFGDWNLALAAYNAGPGTVARAIQRNQDAGLPTDFWSLRLPAETMSYVPRFIAVAQVINNPEKYGVSIRPILNQPHFREVATQGQIDLAKAAQLAGMTMDQLYQLNPAYNHWATDPDGPRRLLVPALTPTDFDAQLAALPAPERVQIQRYAVRKGDTLFRVAKRFDVSPAELKSMNRLGSNKLHRGMVLVVAKASAESAAYSLSQEQRLAKLESVSVTGKDRHHVKVHRGDTIYTVARHNGVNAKDLARWNGISLHDHLHAGQSLSVLVDKADAGSSGSATRRVARNGATAASDDQLKRINYEVRKGDTLAKIATRYRVSVHQIKSWNGRHNIKPGQGLVLYVASNTPRSRHGDDL
jgi:membrane-bound lytic murein transglycosylase D